ncbi:hypothetical protein [Chryseolinea lacunae]|uniref:CHRD domain-containing protein n=1 Tax=Chryseolinea lacunae TaxID=2801331 RepID=A0ABS1KWY0_9BACT|nr:hypothetical protein [Chryseolinea lacunae]MBL0743197.1 hypothetical protein [Chryseolinea lacunae]
MKNILKTKIASLMLMASVATTLLSACEQVSVNPELGTAPGGGTITTFKAYTLDSIPGTGRVYGRVVFWLDNANNTLVQVSLYNTKAGSSYPTGLYAGTVAGGSSTSLAALTPVDGEAGEFAPYKYFVVGKKDFYESLDELDGHVSIFLEDDAVAVGDVGLNAEPVQVGN